MDYYSNNKKVLKSIEKFTAEYSPEHAIKWYTKDTFLYKLVNKTLRTINIDWIYALRFFIVDLCLQLNNNNEYHRQRNTDVVTLYHGRVVSIATIQDLRDNLGKLISMNGFLSTTRSRHVAGIYAREGANEALAREEQVGLLFEITTDARQNIPFVDIAQYTDFHDEEEVLFIYSAIFMIESVELEQTTGLYKVKMATSDAESNQIREYNRFEDQEMRNCPPLVKFGRILFEKNQRSRTSEKIFQYFN